MSALEVDGGSQSCQGVMGGIRGILARPRILHRDPGMGNLSIGKCSQGPADFMELAEDNDFFFFQFHSHCSLSIAGSKSRFLLELIGFFLLFLLTLRVDN